MEENGTLQLIVKCQAQTTKCGRNAGAGKVPFCKHHIKGWFRQAPSMGINVGGNFY